MTSHSLPKQTKNPTINQPVIEFNNAIFPIPKKIATKGSLLDTNEQRLDLSNILPTYLGTFCLEVFSAYVIWLHTQDPVKTIMLFQIGEALKDAVFCDAVAQQLKDLYEQYDEQYGPKI